MATLKDVVSLQKRQINRFKELKSIILRKLSEKIGHLSKHGELKCIYDVPKFYFGFAPYNVEEITVYLLNNLSNEGYCAIKLTDSKIFISWDIKDVNNMLQKAKKEKINLESLLPLVNIKR